MAKHNPIMITEQEYFTAIENMEGFCTACAEFTNFSVEPDARRYECEVCGECTVYGAEESLMCEHFTIDPSSEPSNSCEAMIGRAMARSTENPDWQAGADIDLARVDIKTAIQLSAGFDCRECGRILDQRHTSILKLTDDFSNVINEGKHLITKSRTMDLLCDPCADKCIADLPAQWWAALAKPGRELKLIRVSWDRGEAEVTKDPDPDPRQTSLL